MTSLVRTNELAQKKCISVFAGRIVEGTGNGEIDAAGNGSDDFLLANLPESAIITNAYIHVETASDAATSAVATLGTTEGGSEVLSAADLTTTGEEGTFTGQSLTDSGVELWLGITYTGAATNVGEYIVVVEYLEYEKNTGEYTRF